MKTRPGVHGLDRISAKLFLCGRNLKNEHPPAMHSTMGWCKHGYINQIVKLASHRFQGIAGRSNIERPTSNVELEKMKKQTYELFGGFSTLNVEP